MSLRILKAAFEDLDAGRQFYELQRAGLGAYFTASLLEDIGALRTYAGVHPQYFGFYRSLSRRFPFAIYYRVEGEVIQVWRVLDCRQDPGRTKQALGEA